MTTREQAIAAFVAIAVGPDVEAGQCQRAMGRVGQKLLRDAGLTDEASEYWNAYGFGSATIAFNVARAHGTVYSTNPQEARLLSSVYFGPYIVNGVDLGHVGLVTGPDEFVSITANRAGFLEDLGNGVFRSSISGYARSRPLRGIATTNGNRPALEDLLIQKLAPNQRQVRPVNVNVRAAADPLATEIGELGPNAIVIPLSWKPDGVEHKGVKGWYQVAVPAGRAEPEAFAWAGGFTEASGHDLPLYVAPVEPEPEPVMHTVSFVDAQQVTEVGVRHGESVPLGSIPDPEEVDGFRFDGWSLDGVAPPMTKEVVASVQIVTDVAWVARRTEIIDEPGEEPEPEPEVPGVPIIKPNLENLDDAAVILADAVSPWLSSGARAKVYEWGRLVAAVGASVATAAGGGILFVGADSQVGSILVQVIVYAGAIGGAAGAVATHIARKNTPKEAAKRLAAQGEPLGVATLAKIALKR